MSQPNVSKHIKSLEADLNINLIHRKSQEFTLTDAGEEFYTYAQQIISLYEEAIMKIDDRKKKEQNSLVFGTTTAFGSNFLPEYLRQFNQIHPNTTIKFCIEKSITIISMLEKREIEFAILSEYVASHLSQCEKCVIGVDKLVLIVDSKHPLAKKKTVHLNELNKEYYITKSKDSSLHKFIQSKLDNPEFMKNSQVESGNQFSIREAVIRGIGVSIVSEQVIQPEIKSGKLVALEIEDYPLNRDIMVVYLEETTLSDSAKAFIASFVSEENL